VDIKGSIQLEKGLEKYVEFVDIGEITCGWGFNILDTRRPSRQSTRMLK
jgi:hypothetical protein